MKGILTVFALAVALGSGAGVAQAQTASTVPMPAASGPVQGVAEASEATDYLSQTNGERAKVQPGNNAPMWRQVGQGVQGYSSLPLTQAPEAGVLIQPHVQYPGVAQTNAGEAWRQVRNQLIIPYGAALLFVVLLALALFYRARGRIELHGQVTGRKVERFSAFERATHWANAIAFVVLAVSGLVMAFGQFFLLPVLGATLFGWLGYVLKNIHNFVGPLFVLTTLLMLVTFVRDNLPRAGDLRWLLHFGGLLRAGGKEYPSHRFNAGEKVLFWGGVLALSGLSIASGLFLDKLLPGFAYTRGAMQIAHMVHASAAMLGIALILGHVYLGTIGMTGAYQSMRKGFVDETWAREHHALWWKDVVEGKIKARRNNETAAADVRPVRPAAAGETSP